ALRAGSGFCASAASVAPMVVAARVSVSISLRRLILPVSNALSFCATNPSMRASLASAPERIFLDIVRELDVVIGAGIEHMQTAVAPARYFQTLRPHRRPHPLLIPVGEREAEMIDHRLRRGPVIGNRIARDHEGAALAGLRTEHQVPPLAGILGERQSG